MSQPAEPSQEPQSYWCFISYRHADNKVQDREWANWLHREIERYEVPAELVGTKNGRGDTIPERIYPVFRDEESLPADSDLENTIINALNRSRFLVVLCSPRARESTYVAQEILHFKLQGHSDRIIAAILDGEPGNVERECFPEPLRHSITEGGQLDTSKITEPIAADFRLKDGSEGFTSAEGYRLALMKQGNIRPRDVLEKTEAYDGQLQLMKLKIIAGILGIPLERLRDRDKAYRLELAQRRTRTLRRWMSALVVLLIMACAAGASAWVQRNEAEDQRKKAEAATIEQKKIRARSDFRLALEQFNDETAGEDDRRKNAAAFLARTLRADPSHSQAQRFAAQLLPKLLDEVPSQVVPAASPSSETDRFSLGIAQHSTDGERIQLLFQGATLEALRNEEGRVEVATLNAVGARALNPKSFRFPDPKLNSAALSPSGSRLALSGEKYDSSEGIYQYTTRIYDWAAASQIGSAISGTVRCFSPDGELVLTQISDQSSSRLMIWDARTGERRKDPFLLASDSSEISFDATGSSVVFLASSGEQSFRVNWPVRSTAERQVPIRIEGGRADELGINSISFSHSGERAAIGFHNDAVIVDVPNRSIVARFPFSDPHSNIFLSPDGHSLVEVTPGSILLRDVGKKGELLSSFPLPDELDIHSFVEKRSFAVSHSDPLRIAILQPQNVRLLEVTSSPPALGNLREFHLPQNIHSINITRNGRFLHGSLIDETAPSAFVIDLKGDRSPIDRFPVPAKSSYLSTFLGESGRAMGFGGFDTTLLGDRSSKTWNTIEEGDIELGIAGFEGTPVLSRIIFDSKAETTRAGISNFRQMGSKTLQQYFIADTKSGHLRSHIADIDGYDGEDDRSLFSTDLSQLIAGRDNAVIFFDTQTGLQWLDEWNMPGDSRVGNMKLSLDQEVLLVHSWDDRVHIREFPPLREQLPTHLPELLEHICGRFVDEGAVIRNRKTGELDEWFFTFQSLVESCEDTYPELVWALDRTAKRTINPYVTLTLEEFVQSSLEKNTLTAFLEAHRALPDEPLVHLALGLVEPNPDQARWLINLGISESRDDVLRLSRAYTLLKSRDINSPQLTSVAARIEALGGTPPSDEIQPSSVNQSATIQRSYINEGLKNVVKVTLTINGTLVKGVLQIEDTSLERTESIQFNGVTDGANLRVQLDKSPDYLNLTNLDGERFVIWHRIILSNTERLDLGDLELHGGPE